ncbi:calcium-binding protein [Niveispirillum sp. KHB5.9]|uniref:calcium-binding protein n=1 Tax=Niveispirillum sp. KHB5.9 TaxID=3400269 RepID=UPI003A83A7BD
MILSAAAAAGSVINGGNTDDNLNGTTGNDTLNGGGGSDILNGDAGDDSLSGGDGIDELHGGPGADILLGGASDDVLEGGLGDDTLDGGDGDDILYHRINATTAPVAAIIIGEGTLTSDQGTDILRNIERAWVEGSALADNVTGSSRQEVMYGGDGADTLNGGGGNDTLMGGKGADILTGGTGQDHFEFHAPEFDTVDTVTDFAQGDMLTFATYVGQYLQVKAVSAIGQGNGAGLTDGQVHVQAIDGGVRVMIGLDSKAGYDAAVDLKGSFDLSRFVAVPGGIGYRTTDIPQGTSGNDLLVGSMYGDTLRGGAGADRLVGNGGPDLLDGGAGVDAVGLNLTIDQLYLARMANGSVAMGVKAWGNPIVSELANVEFLYLSDRVLLITGMEEAMSANLPLGYSEQGYLAVNPDVAAAVAAGVFRNGYQHYTLHGKAEGRSPTALFDANWYLEQNPDVKAAGVRALDHFMNNGWREARDPSASFDVSAYLERHPDIAAAGMNPLVHLLGWGLAEGRIFTAADSSWIG